MGSGALYGHGDLPHGGKTHSAEITVAPYCICNTIDPDMWMEKLIQCDHVDCPTKWFHLACVGLSDHLPTRVAWLCPTCRIRTEEFAGRKRKKSKKRDRKRKRLPRLVCMAGHDVPLVTGDEDEEPERGRILMSSPAVRASERLAERASKAEAVAEDGSSEADDEATSGNTADTSPSNDSKASEDEDFVPDAAEASIYDPNDSPEDSHGNVPQHAGVEYQSTSELSRTEGDVDMTVYTL